MRWLLLMAITCQLACAPSQPAIVPGKVPTIDEITMERSSISFNPLVYKIVLRKDGTASYTGESNVVRIGTFKATIALEEFRRLEELVGRWHILSMQEGYPGVVDSASVTITFFQSGHLKSFTYDEGSRDIPVELWAIEKTIDGFIANITDWKPIN